MRLHRSGDDTNRCPLCQRNPAEGDDGLCPECVAALAVQLDRRRDAERRLPPLADAA